MKKPNLAILIGTKKPGHDEEHEAEGGPSVEEIKTHQHKVGEELLKAIEEKDAAGIVEAFCVLHELDHAKWDAEEEEGESPEEEKAEHEEGEEEAAEEE
jgi:hypothetical protein